MDSETRAARWFAFDPTIHAGHLLTAITIIACTFSAWYGLVGRINALESENTHRVEEIKDVKADAVNRNRDMMTRIDTIVSVQRQEVGQLRDDMKSWFMNLDQKLDRKADKK